MYDNPKHHVEAKAEDLVGVQCPSCGHSNGVLLGDESLCAKCGFPEHFPGESESLQEYAQSDRGGV